MSDHELLSARAPASELSDTDLEHVVGGLARAWPVLPAPALVPPLPVDREPGVAV